jgi:tetratricopeptide (TPR) repeat protein
VESGSLSIKTACSIASLLAALDGYNKAVPLCSAILHAASTRLDGIQPPAEGETVAALWTLHNTFVKCNQWELDQHFLELVRPWERRGSAHSQLASYLYLESLYMQAKLPEALSAAKAAIAEHSTAPKLAEGINRPLDWEVGLILYDMGSYRDAIPHFEVTRSLQGVPESKAAWPYEIICRARDGDIDQANSMINAWIVAADPDAITVARVIKMAGLSTSGYSTSLTATNRVQDIPSPGDCIAELEAEPRNAVTKIQRARILDTLFERKDYQQVADIALRCIQGQPDRLDRVEYFLKLRIRSLLGSV